MYDNILTRVIFPIGLKNIFINISIYIVSSVLVFIQHPTKQPRAAGSLLSRLCSFL